MHRRVVLSFAILLGLVAVAQATPTIVVGSHPNIPIAASTTIDIFVTGMGTSPSSISGIDLNISIASQHLGASNGDPAPAGEPLINGVDVVTGTIFAGNSTATAPGQVIFPSPVVGDSQYWNVDDTTNSGVLTADGKLFTIDLNTLGVAPGTTWSLIVLQGEGGAVTSSYSNDQVLGVEFLGSNGTFTIVPEPGSVALGLFAVAGLGAVAIRRRRARG